METRFSRLDTDAASRIYTDLELGFELTSAIVFDYAQYEDRIFKINFRSVGNQQSDQFSVLFTFDVCPLAIRIIDEGDYSLCWGIGKKNFFTVKNSEYIDWFCSEGEGVHEEREIVHYAFYTDFECIDVLSKSAPEIIKIPY